MNGNLMDTTCNGIVNATTITCHDQNISDLTGIQYFNSLLVLNCWSNSLTSLPTLPLSLTELLCDRNNLTSLPVLPNNIYFLRCDDNPLIHLPTLPTALQILECQGCQLIDIPQLPLNVYEFICSNNQLTTLPTLPSAVQYLYCKHNLLTSLPLLPNSLTQLGCDSNLISQLPAFPASLNRLNCSNNQLTSLPDLPTALQVFLIRDNPNLMCMPVLNNFTSSNSSWFSISNTGIDCFPNLIQHPGNIAAIDTMPICDAIFNPHNCPTHPIIYGNVFQGFNANCIYEAGEQYLNHFGVSLYQSGNYISKSFTNANGEYDFLVDTGNYDVVVDSTNSLRYSCPLTGTYNVTCPGTPVSVPGFELECDTLVGYDIGTIGINHGAFGIPGHLVMIHMLTGDLSSSLNGTNCYTLTLSGQVKVIITGEVSFSGMYSGGIIPASVAGDTIVWNINDFSIPNLDNLLRFYIMVDTLAQLGTLVCFDIEVTPTLGDANPVNNSFVVCGPIISSMDPNFKEVEPTTPIPTSYSDWLTYTVHFQNTGTAPADHIKILDTLDTNLDPVTFQYLESSHNPTVSVIGNISVFDFQNINLPDSSVNEEASQGWVMYRIKLKQGIQPGIINNTASIYFDFNSPVVTNTVSNLICNPIAPTTLSQTICAGDSYNFNGNNLSTAGNYSVTLNAINGCDSVVNLNLVVLAPSDTLLSQQICGGEIFSFNGMNLNTTGIYADTLSNISGCDSIVTLNLNVLEPNMAVTQAGATLSSNAAWATYQWLNCDNGFAPLIGDTNAIFVATANGNYAVAVTQMGCTDTSACYSVTGIGIDELTIDHSLFTIYPNPSDDEVTISLSQPCENCKIEITNTLGQFLFVKSINDKVESINLDMLPAGIYFITVRADKFIGVKKLVKE